MCFFSSPSLLICKSPSTTQLFTTFGVFFQPLHILSRTQGLHPPPSTSIAWPEALRGLQYALGGPVHQGLATWLIGPRWGSISSNPRWFLPKVGDVSRNSSEFHHRVFPFQEFILKILLERWSGKDVLGCPSERCHISEIASHTERPFLPFPVSHEIIMISSRITLSYPCYTGSSHSKPRGRPGQRTTLVELLEPIHPNLSYLLSSSWEKQRLCHNVDTFCDDCWSSSAARAAQDCEHLGGDSCLRSGWILVQQGLLWEYNFETDICHLFNPAREVRRDEMSRLDK